MGIEAEIQRKLKEMTAQAAMMTPAEVVSIEKDTHTITVLDVYGTKIPDVRLKSVIKNGDAIILYPAVGSIVQISPIGKEDTAEYKVMAVEEIQALEAKIGNITLDYDADGIRLNGDTLGGLVNAKELKKQVDRNTKVLKGLVNALNVWVPATGTPDSGALLKTAFVESGVSALPLADLGNIENEKVTHG